MTSTSKCYCSVSQCDTVWYLESKDIFLHYFHDVISQWKTLKNTKQEVLKIRKPIKELLETSE
jgi:hypothetical protein